MLDQNGDVTDGELVDCYVAERDSAAFEKLVRRHGAMVLAVCRRVLRDSHDAEDAFQAVFLVLQRKAHSIRPPSMVANWLYGVAYRTALKAKSVRHGMRARETQIDPVPERPAAQDQRCSDLELLLDEELAKLPDKYRLPIVLCELEGSSIKDAARLLGCPEGTVAGRLSRGRTLLRDRIARRGLMLSLTALSAGLAQQASAAAVPAPLLTSTIHGANLLASGQAGLVELCSVKVAALTKGVLKSMLLAKLKLVGGTVAALGIVGVGGIVATELAGESSRRMPALFAQAPAQESDAEEREQARLAAQEAAAASEVASAQAEAASQLAAEHAASAASAEESRRMAEQAALEARRMAEQEARRIAEEAARSAANGESEAAPAEPAREAAPAAPAQPRENSNTNTNSNTHTPGENS